MSDSLKFFWLFWFTAILCFIVTESMAGMCEKVATDCIEGGDTRLIDGVSVYRDCWRYEYAYKCKGYALNNCAEYKDEAYCLAYQSECIVNVGNWCVAQKHNYKCEEEEKYIRQEKRFRYPTMKKDNFLERKKVVCNEKIRCVDGKCFDYTSDANNEMGEAASMLNALKEMQGDYAKHLSVFKGDVKKCSNKAFSLNNCCKPGGKAFIEKVGLSQCGDGEKDLGKLIAEDKCYYVGKYTKKFIGIKQKTTYSYCCFASKLAREINAQSRAKGLVNKDWGSPENPNCSGFSLEELQGVDFSKIDFGFMAEEINKKALWTKMGDMAKALEHTRNIMEGEVNIIKNDVKSSAPGKESASDILEEIDEDALYRKKFDEKHDDIFTQKKPDGRDKTRDTILEPEKDYNVDDPKKRDEGGLL